MLLDDLLDLLTSGGAGTAGTDLFGGPYPATPVEVIGLLETGGMPGTYTMTTEPGLEHPRVQAMVRSETYTAGRNRAQQCANLLDGLRSRLVNGVRYHWAQVVTPPTYVGQDANARYLFSLNFDVVRDRSGTS